MEPTQPVALDAMHVPFKFVLSPPIAVVHYSCFESPLSRTLASLCERLRSWTKESRIALSLLVQDTNEMEKIAHRISASAPFANIANSDVNEGAARVVFAMLSSCNETTGIDFKEAFLHSFSSFWSISSCAPMDVCRLCPHGVYPFEYHYMRADRVHQYVTDYVSCTNDGLSSDSSDGEHIYATEEQRVIVSKLREIMNTSTFGLSDCIVPCGSTCIRTAEYYRYLATTRLSALGLMQEHASALLVCADAFMLASLCGNSSANENEFVLLLESMQSCRAFEPPRGPVAFVWVAVCACLNGIKSRRIASVANEVVAILKKSNDEEGLRLSLARLALLAISSRTRAGFKLVLYNKAIRAAACSTIKSIGGTFLPTCLDVFSVSPSGLLGLPHGKVVEKLFRMVVFDFCTEGDDNRVKTWSVRRFVSIDAPLYEGNEAMAAIVKLANIALEKSLSSSKGPMAFLSSSNTLCQQAERAAIFRCKTISAIREAFRCRTCCCPQNRTILVAWISSDEERSKGHVATFARRFIEGTDICEYSVCFDFEDELRNSIRTTSFEGTYGNLKSNIRSFPVIDFRTGHELMHMNDHMDVCTNVHTPLNGYASVSVVHGQALTGS